MKVQLAKWGNSLALRIPRQCARQAHIKAGDAVEVEVPQPVIYVCTQ